MARENQQHVKNQPESALQCLSWVGKKGCPMVQTWAQPFAPYGLYIKLVRLSLAGIDRSTTPMWGKPVRPSDCCLARGFIEILFGNRRQWLWCLGQNTNLSYSAGIVHPMEWRIATRFHSTISHLSIQTAAATYLFSCSHWHLRGGRTPRNKYMVQHRDTKAKPFDDPGQSQPRKPTHLILYILSYVKCQNIRQGGCAVALTMFFLGRV